MGAVTTAIPPSFVAQMRRLAGLKFAPDRMDTHWDGLSDLSSDDLARAVSRAVRECEAFPAPAELRRLALEAAPPIPADEDRSVPLAEPMSFTVPHVQRPLVIEREWRYYCEDCSDTGWRTAWCGDLAQKPPWQSMQACDRHYPHNAHDWAQTCPCVERNPAVKRKRDRAAQQAAHRTAQPARPH